MVIKIRGCDKEYDENNTIRYLRRSTNLCFDCFINKYDELSKNMIYVYYNILNSKLVTII